MAADTHSEAVPCPDPSAHEKSHKLSEQASTAALYVTHPERRVGDSRQSTEEVLGPDGKLSSKSAATSLKYAKATDLPSFPSTGNASGSAGKAAMLAKDYKMKELWQPEQSMAGSKAAVLAAGKGGKVDLWEAQATAAGQSAATLAFRNKGLSPQAYGGNSAEEKSKALRAATMSHHAGRQRAESTPAPPPALYPDAHNSGANALNAATVSHRASTKKSDGWDSAANQAARVKNIDMNKEMFTDHPGYQYEEDDHQAALKASAISMAKKMYESQNRSAMLQDPDGSDLAGARTAARSQAAAPDVKQEALQYISMQDAAHKLAAERLAKIDKSMENQRFREYYGYEDKPKRLSSRLSVRGRGRNRASSEGAGSFMDDSDDEETARKIRTQMANLSSGLSNVDAKKQQDDRAKLLAAAEKRVSSRMHDMDEQVYRDTGKVSQSMMDDWEAKAMEKAQKDRELQAQNPGKMHIGGGKFMEQSEIEAIAAARLKPTLDEINDTAEKRRERDIEMARERDEEQTRKMEEKMRKQAEKDEQKRIKAELKESSKREKEAEKSEQQRIKNELRESNKREKDEEKARKAETRKSHDQKRDTLPAAATGVAVGGVAAEELKHDHDEEPTEEAGVTDGREKHRSALARLKDKFRKSGAPEEKEKVEPEAEKPVEEKTHDKTAIAGGAAAGAATGAALADIEHTHHDQSLDAQQATFAATQDEDRPTTATTGTTATTTVPAVIATEPEHEPVSPITPSERNVPAAAPEPAPFVTSAHDIAPVAATAPALPPVIAVGDMDADDEDDSLYEESQSARPSRPGFQQTGSFAGYHNDQAGTLGAPHMPTLERHISQIPESESGSDSDDEDWNDERPSRGRTGVHEEPADAVVGQPAVHSETHDHAVPYIGAAAAGASYVPLEERAVQQPPQQTSDANLGVGQRAFQEEQHAPVPVSAVTSATTTAPLAERVVHQPREQPTEANVGVGQQAFQQEQHVPATATTGVAAAPVVEPIAQQPLAQKSDANLGIGEREWKTETHTGAPVAAAAGGAAGGAAVATTAAAAEPPHPSNEVYDETMTRMNEQRAEPPKDLPATLKTPGVPKDTDAASTVAIPPASAPGSPTDKHKRNESGVIAGAAGVGTAGAAAVGASEFSKKDAEKKAEPTSPIKRDTEKSTEKPSEKDDKKGLRGFFSKMRHGSKSEKKQPGSFMAADKKEKDKDEKKSVPYDSTKAGDKPVVVANKSEAEKSPTSPTGTATSSTIPPVDVGPEFKASDQHIGTDGPIGDKEHVSGLHGNPAAAEPESPSSFTRGEATGADPDDVSSSGVDEEDIKRGRGGRFARKLFGKPKDERDLLEKHDKVHGRGRASEDTSGRDARTSGVSTTEDENDQFEEARDHFDENLAPPPAFAGQKKSESPVRATRFHEEV